MLTYFNMNQYGFVKIALILALVLVGIGGYFVLSKDSLKESRFETEVIKSLQTDWQMVQASIPFRPSHPGTTAWIGPYSVQFIGNNNLLVYFEDGYNPGIAVLNFDDGKFKILETFKNQGDFTVPEWQNLVKKYGDPSSPVSTYTSGIVRNKEIISFQELTKVPENIFTKYYWE